VAWEANLLCVSLLFRIVARRSGPLLGLAAGLSLLFLGRAFEVLLQPFQMQYLSAAAAASSPSSAWTRRDEARVRLRSRRLA
jgi:hypothetical protein